MPLRLDARSSDFELSFSTLLKGKRETLSDVSAAVAEILASVQARGDAAVIDYTHRFDRVSAPDLRALKVSWAEILAAETACPPDLLAALDLAAQRIADFHAHQIPEDLRYTDSAGVELGLRWQPVMAAGLYVPGGLASYPSSVLMNALPAKVAGVDRIVMVVPAPDGNLNPAVLAAAKRAGVTEIYKIGGAQAIAALAYGTESIAPVDKIVGPGNAYVAAAKRAVFGQVGIDSIAGPSEILVVADNQTSPDWIALDLLSQAEHDPSAQSILIASDSAFADAVAAAVELRLETLPRSEIAAASWRDHGAILLVETLDAALPLIDRIAPEHLLLAMDAPQRFAARIRNAGAIFLGRHTPEAVGDYIAGPNHVLPTARSARFSSGLSVFDFMKRTSLIGCNLAALATLAPSIQSLAAAEGLGAHGLSVAVRLGETSR